MGPVNRKSLARLIKRGPVRRVGHFARSAIVPEREWLVSETGALSSRIVALRDDHNALRLRADRAERQVTELSAQADDLRRQVADLQQQVAEFQDGMREARRLNLRIAELTDLVTELVLPLHDRDIDIQRLHPHTTDTL